jgi:membrane associated rhomboid family serine protease
MRPSRRSSQTFARPWVAGRISVTSLLVALMGGAFGAQWLLEFLARDRLADPGWLQQWLALNYEGIAAGHWWQFLTYGLLHAGPLHAVGNALLLYFAGREVEPIIGGRHLAAIFVGGIVLGGIAQCLGMPGSYQVVGTSAGVAAVMVSYATVLAEFDVVGHLFFVIPLRLRAKFFGWVVFIFGAVCWATQTLEFIGPAAICIGCATGWIYTRELGFGNSFWWERRSQDRRQKEERLQRMSADQFVEEQVDPILDKIAREGIQSLTREEKRMLEQGSAKISERETAD